MIGFINAGEPTVYLRGKSCNSAIIVSVVFVGCANNIYIFFDKKGRGPFLYPYGNISFSIFLIIAQINNSIQ